MDVFQISLVLKPESRKTIQASLKGDVCIIRYPQPWSARKKYLLPMIDQIYWRLLGRLYNPRLKLRTAELNRAYFSFDYRDVRYHRQFRRWGSCSALKNINLSHRLIGAPGHLTDYVIIHELAHIQYLNHGKEFWGLVGSTGVNPKIMRKEFEMYGYSWLNSYRQWCQQLLKLV
ncbi:MAG: YgjP-like metallopeptidase domain-containing protein [Bacillota bacterium]